MVSPPITCLTEDAPTRRGESGKAAGVWGSQNRGLAWNPGPSSLYGGRRKGPTSVIWGLPDHKAVMNVDSAA